MPSMRLQWVTIGPVMINVLIAEDNAAYRETLHQVLSGRFPFMRITETADGKDTLHQALARHYDLIFMDIRLPQGNGLDLTRAIKAVFADSVVCVITSYDFPEYRDAAFRNGADRFMVKGESTGEEILSVVDALLQARYRTLIVVGDALLRRQLAALLSIRWPAMIVAEAANETEGLDRRAQTTLGAARPGAAGLPARRADSRHPGSECAGEAHRHDVRRDACIAGAGDGLWRGLFRPHRSAGAYRAGRHRQCHAAGSGPSLSRGAGPRPTRSTDPRSRIFYSEPLPFKCRPGRNGVRVLPRCYSFRPRLISHLRTHPGASRLDPVCVDTSGRGCDENRNL